MIKYVEKVPLSWWLGLVIQSSVFIPLRIAAIVLGLFVVPVALLFKKQGDLFGLTVEVDGETRKVFKREVHLPKWAWLWDNHEEGMSSKYQYWWDQHNGKADSYWAMVKWGCLRNPANNMRTLSLFQVDLIESDHICYKKGFLWIAKSKRGGDFSKYSLRYRRSWVRGNKAGDFIFHIGYKTLEHSITTYINSPTVMEAPHQRYRGYALQIIPGKGLREV